jgi:elongation factor Ts
MSITAKAVNELRKITGAGMMDCKKALQEADGDQEKAIDILRKKGQKISAKRADRDAAEGAIIALSSDDHSYGVVVEVNCETDFVAKNDDFVSFATQVAQTALDNKPADLDALKSLEIDGKSISEHLTDQMGKIGEKIEVGSYELMTGDAVVSYIHAGNKLGVLVALNKSANDDVVQAGKDVAMQIAAMNPVGVDENDVPDELKEREMEIGREQARAEGKPDNLVDKIAMGKLNRFYKDNTLLKQPFVKDSSKSVEKMLDEVEGGLSVSGFKRVALGA